MENLVWNLFLVPEEIRVMKFVLETAKLKHFIITFTGDFDLIVELFDGPGTHSSNIYRKNNETYVTSTFQSVIYMWIPFTKKLNAESGFQFLTESSSISLNLKLNDSFLHTISHAPIKYEVWKILSYYNVNITIINLTYIGFNDPLCTFAGISVYSLDLNSYKEIANECTSLDNFFSHRNIYSKSKETLLVLYSYNKYGNLSFTMQFATTKCKPVIINTCAVSYPCKFNNNTMCRQHREQTRSLNLKHSKMSKDVPVSMDPNHCVIFQMVAVTDILDIDGNPFDCEIKFHHINILKTNIDIHFNIKACMQGKYKVNKTRKMVPY